MFLQNGGSVVAAVRPGSAQESIGRDAEVRPALRAYLEEQELACPDTALIEELGFCQGRARIDLATVSGVVSAQDSGSDRNFRLTSVG